MKVDDVCVTMLFNDTVWNKCNFEPLIIVIILYFYNTPPWKLIMRDSLENAREVCRYSEKMIAFGEESVVQFLKPRDHWEACQGIWCGISYKAPRGEGHRVVRSQE